MLARGTLGIDGAALRIDLVDQGGDLRTSWRVRYRIAIVSLPDGSGSAWRIEEPCRLRRDRTGQDNGKHEQQQDANPARNRSIRRWISL